MPRLCAVEAHARSYSRRVEGFLRCEAPRHKAVASLKLLFKLLKLLLQLSDLVL
jgi:hypothetical protein